ncbi:site-specific integrase [Microcoleus sp. FACHB-SPT15]|uniref:tyrosine-type recombinase/integrase n=1 Tax=Microcoleus sp. FACHB-SPT15 TaxID=2692830 RepID=UPI00177E3D2E|nr:site-specific integrase [Microcoleus sp. FACHB-SPT15]MBD1804058.1 site-specific integrase [Microcoleus sp. FACHB-SPT15]
MKVDRHGKAKILTQQEIQLLFREGFQNSRDRALFGICLFSACRVNEACTLKVRDAYDTAGRVRPKLIIRKQNTKGKLATRTIPVIEDLRLILTNYQPAAGQDYLFPGRFSGHIDPESASRILRKALRRVGIEGVSTHSFRRTALTQMSNAGIPLRIIQEVSGHRSLSQLQNYLEVQDSQVLGAVTALSMLSPVGEEVRKYEYVDLPFQASQQAENNLPESPS